jgi:hypothetical protein
MMVAILRAGQEAFSVGTDERVFNGQTQTEANSLACAGPLNVNNCCHQ